MELLQLRKFCHAARSGSFSATARTFGVPPSDISQTVRRLERELGTELFTRRANAVTLNERGRAFAAQAERALAILDAAAEGAAEGGHLRLCINTNRRIVMAAVEQFRREFPAVTVTTRTFTDPTAQDFDLVISAREERLRHWRETKLLSEQLAVACRRGSPWEGLCGQLAALHDAPFITMGEDSSLCRLTRQLCREAGFSPRVAVQSDDPYYVRRCAELGLGVAVVPLFSWQGQFPEDVALTPLAGAMRDTFAYTAPDCASPWAARFLELLVGLTGNS